MQERTGKHPMSSGMCPLPLNANEEEDFEICFSSKIECLPSAYGAEKKKRKAAERKRLREWKPI